MSQQNIDFMRHAFEAFVGGDIATLAEALHPDVEWKAVEDPVAKRGFDGVLESLAGWFEVWDEIHVELEELVDAGTSVVAVVNMRGQHAGSRSEVSERFFQVWTLSQDMKIVSFYEFKSRPEALQAAGLSEQDAQGPVNRA